MAYERMGRYRLMAHETFSPEKRLILLTAGIDPDALRTVVDTFDDPSMAEIMLAVTAWTNDDDSIRYYLHDAGEEEVMEFAMEIVG